MMNYLSAAVLRDFYKFSHIDQYPAGYTGSYSTWVPRQSRIPGVDYAIAFGFQPFVREWLIDFFQAHFFQKPWADVQREFIDISVSCLGATPSLKATAGLRDVHRLGYLPIIIRALPEGTPCPIRVPMAVVYSDFREYGWVVGALETLMSTELWQGITSATIASKYRKLLDKWARQTVGNTGGVDFQAHDFSMRGMAGVHAGMKSAAAHLVYFKGTDTAPAIPYIKHFYGTDDPQELIGASIPATEHSVMCAYQKDSISFPRLINEVYPSGFVSIVSDTWNLWHVLENILPSLKDDILRREGRVVIRPDSGDPVKIMCGDSEGTCPSQRKGVVETLYDIFGGTVSPTGYKLLNPKIGSIYGDSITPERADEICAKLAEKGFASTNAVFGIGSYTYQHNTRDTLGLAMKSTCVVINDKVVPILKNPVTDIGSVKRSNFGWVSVTRNLDTGLLQCKDGLDWGQTAGDEEMLEVIYDNGRPEGIETFTAVRERAARYI